MPDKRPLDEQLADLKLQHAGLEGRVRFYLSVLRGGATLPVEQLADCIEGDLARLKEARANRENTPDNPPR
jgi:hypothetical protein